ncbi:hypothetical protein PGT21_000607 [Puccinia graminis f. sp. tritici]|uniref:Programmed cell death protein 5 n=1 Tax=Puccinia graminis f. sp. tritici TaxID=56615 RepID=A0A5B0LQX0_PUCGR|nr:hypothetical protein PGT21_000607 [Puccinia graminis f. sp. tritici]
MSYPDQTFPDNLPSTQPQAKFEINFKKSIASASNRVIRISYQQSSYLNIPLLTDSRIQKEHGRPRVRGNSTGESWKSSVHTKLLEATELTKSSLSRNDWQTSRVETDGAASSVPSSVMSKLGGQPAGSGEEEAKKAENEEIRRTAVSQIIDNDARERLSRIALVRPQRARQIEDMLIRMAQSGQLRGRVTEEQLISVLDQLERAKVARLPQSINPRRSRMCEKMR